MRLGVAATPDVAIPTLEWLLTTAHTIDLIITQPDKPAGRGRTMRQSDVAQWADDHKIPVIKPASAHELSGQMNALDLVLTIGYGKLIPEELLSQPRLGFLNLHFSLLPAYRGAAPAQRALLDGQTQTGVTVFQLDKGMDTGPIYSQISLAIDPRWRAFELLGELAGIGVTAVEQAFAEIAKGAEPAVQSGASCLAPKISKSEARLDFESDAMSVVNAVRAFTYEPGSWTLWREDSFKVRDAILCDDRGLMPGEIEASEDHLFVGCANGSTIELLRVTPAGKSEMSAVDWARGVRLQGGERFG